MLKHNLSILGSKYIYIALILNSNKDSLFIYEDPFEERVYCNKPNGDFFCGHSFVCLFVPFEVGILLKISAPQKSLSTGSWKRGGGAGRQGGGAASIMPFSWANKYNCRTRRLNFNSGRKV